MTSRTRDQPVSDGMIGAFVDGGASMSNIPALQLFLMATLKGFRLEWARGADRLLLVSVGTRYSLVQMARGRINDLPALQPPARRDLVGEGARAGRGAGGADRAGPDG